MRSKNPPRIPAGISEITENAAAINDAVMLYNNKGILLFSSGSVEIINLLPASKLPQLNKLKKGKLSALLTVGDIKSRVLYTLIKSGAAEYILCTANYVQEPVMKGLLWESFYSKNEPSYSLIAGAILGYTQEEINLLPGKAFSLLPEEDSEHVKKILANFIVDTRRNELELIYHIRTKPGKMVWIQETVITKRNSAGEIFCSESSVSDMTRLLEEKKNLEEKVEILRKLNQAKDQFISVLSHDLKSPYTSILGFSEILLTETSLTADERAEYLSYINSSSQAQLKLINNLLEWSRLVTGRKQIEPVKINLKSLINTVVGNYTRSIHLKNIDLRMNSDNYVYVLADERLLQEVISIMISNAVKYSSHGGTVDIYISKFRENQVEVIIKDEGMGMNERNKERILKIDQVFSTPGTGGERGTGISLILADEIIKSHKGQMWFYSEEGKGSEFHFTVPVSGSMILVVDENETEKLKIKNMVNSGFPEFKFRTESNLVSALGLIHQENPSIVITSHKLPLMNGFEFLKALRAEERYAYTPVIVYSADANEKLREDYKSMGVTHVLTEPVNLKDLREAIEENLK